MSAKARLNIGLIGLGRLGQVYARDLATRIPCTRLAAVADVNAAAVDAAVAQFGAKGYTDVGGLLSDTSVEAFVIVSPTHMHAPHTAECAALGKPIFCEKPPSISLDGAMALKRAVDTSGVFFQLGLMRRFDVGYVAAKAKIDQGAIGKPVVFKSTSRDPFPPSVEFANPKHSGGMIVDMGIHDFDLARWFMGDVTRVSAIGGVLCYPELGTVGDIDNAVVSLEFADGTLGVVDLTRNGIYGYDISTELLGSEGTVRIGYLRETPLTVMTRNAVTHDTVPYFMERFRDAYPAQLENFAQNVLQGRPAPITVDDGVEALRIALAATKARETGTAVEVGSITA